MSHILPHLHVVTKAHTAYRDTQKIFISSESVP